MVLMHAFGVVLILGVTTLAFFEESLLDVRYRQIINVNRSLEMLRELQAPAPKLRETGVMLQKAVGELFSTIRERSTSWSPADAIRARACIRARDP